MEPLRPLLGANKNRDKLQTRQDHNTRPYNIARTERKLADSIPNTETRKRGFQGPPRGGGQTQAPLIKKTWGMFLAHQNRTIAIASDFRIDGAKSPEIVQKKRDFGLKITAITTRNRKSLATFHRTLKSQCKTALSCLGNR